MSSCRALLVIGALAACGKPHDPRAVEIDSDDCIPCHRPDYEDARSPVHIGLMPDTCADCHRTTFWRPATAGQHPEERFPIATLPHQLACSGCHRPAPGRAPGARDTDCVGCHTGEHTLALMAPAHAAVPHYEPDPARPDFCLDCHPDGKK